MMRWASAGIRPEVHDSKGAFVGRSKVAAPSEPPFEHSVERIGVLVERLLRHRLALLRLDLTGLGAAMGRSLQWVLLAVIGVSLAWAALLALAILVVRAWIPVTGAMAMVTTIQLFVAIWMLRTARSKGEQVTRHLARLDEAFEVDPKDGEA